jgi:hypothetical protein
LEASPSRQDVRKQFALVHNGYLTLNDAIARNAACFGPALADWRRARDRWARFYSEGWSSSRYEEMRLYRLELLRWRRIFLSSCGLTGAEVPVYAARA